MRAIAVFAGLLILCVAAHADSSSLLQLDTGGHTAKIKNVAFTPDGKYVVSAGLDKVIRIWDWRAEKTVRTIRGQSGPGYQGIIHATSLSPDGRLLAVGGWFSRSDEKNPEGGAIRLFDFQSGELRALLIGHTGAVLSIAFSPDGKKLISGSGVGDFSAIIWDVERKTLLHRLEGHRGEIYAAGFTPDGDRAVTGSFDATLRLWNVANGEPLGQPMTGHVNKVRSLAISPKDGAIASGDKSGEIRLWNGKTGMPMKVLANQGAEVGSLSFSRDGRLLLSTYGECTSCKYTQRIWNTATGQEVTSYAQHDNIVVAGAFSPDGRLVATGGGNSNEIHIWDPMTGEFKAVLKGKGRPVRAVAFSASGRSIAWGTGAGETGHEPLELALHWPGADPTLARPEPVKSQDEWAGAKPSFQDFTLARRKGGDGYDDAVLELLNKGSSTGVRIERGAEDGYRHRSFTFTPDGKQIVSGGSNGVLTAYGLDGKPVRNFVGHEGEVLGVAVSPDGRYLVSGSDDQTVRLWDVKTGGLLATLFRSSDEEWVIWTPEGFYAGSEGGAKLAGWQINKGPEKAADYVTAEQLRTTLLRPDLIAKKIRCPQDYEDARKACAYYQEQANRFRLETVLASGAAPEVGIVSPAGGMQARGATVTVTARILDKGGGIGRITWRVNGQERRSVFGQRMLDSNHQIASSFDLAQSTNKIEVIAENAAGLVVSKAAGVIVEVDEKELKVRPDLYVLAIGVDNYKDVRGVLRYAVDDGLALEDALAEAGKDYYQHKPTVILLKNDEVTADKVSATLKDLGAKVKARDVFVFFVAGHGKTIDGDYYFVPRGVDSLTEDAIQRQGFGPAQWRAWFLLIQAQKSLWIIDTCDAGSAEGIFKRGLEDETAYMRLMTVTGRTIFMASSAEQDALEGYGNHGVLTYTILEGLARAGNPSSKMVELADLKTFVETKVPEYSRALPSCHRTLPDQICQTARVSIPGNTFPLVPRYLGILAKLNASAPRFSAIPSHVVLPPGAEVFKAPGQGQTGQEDALKAGTAVFVIKSEGGWAYIARGGIPLGFVPQERLLKIE